MHLFSALEHPTIQVEQDLAQVSSYPRYVIQKRLYLEFQFASVRFDFDTNFVVHYHGQESE